MKSGVSNPRSYLILAAFFVAGIVLAAYAPPPSPKTGVPLYRALFEDTDAAW